eukprot:g1735.t1
MTRLRVRRASRALTHRSSGSSSSGGGTVALAGEEEAVEATFIGGDNGSATAESAADSAGPDPPWLDVDSAFFACEAAQPADAADVATCSVNAKFRSYAAGDLRERSAGDVCGTVAVVPQAGPGWLSVALDLGGGSGLDGIVYFKVPVEGEGEGGGGDSGRGEAEGAGSSGDGRDPSSAPRSSAPQGGTTRGARALVRRQYEADKTRRAGTASGPAAPLTGWARESGRSRLNSMYKVHDLEHQRDLSRAAAPGTDSGISSGISSGIGIGIGISKSA